MLGFLPQAAGIVVALGALIAPVAAQERQQPKAAAVASGERSPWGVASGAEWFSDFSRFNPMLRTAGVRWLRGFYEWQDVQPRPGIWNFAHVDRLVRDAKANDIGLVYGLAYLASWASADGGTRKFPIKDIQFWRDYVKGMVGRYHGDIKYWEVWNEFNGSFAEGGTPQIYAELVREASIVAKNIDPTARIGISVANFDVGFLDAAIKAGASGHFDYLCVHPYEKLEALRNEGGEIAFLSMTTTLRQMLAANGQRKDMPLWITEIGSQAPIKPNSDGDKAQATMLAKAYLLSIAAGFERVFWFEARGPAYGHDTDHGLLRADFSPRPSYQALKVLTGALGPEPSSAGWLDLDNGGFGFLFQSAGRSVLAAWAPPKQAKQVSFAQTVRVLDLEGKTKSLNAGDKLTLTDTPVLIADLPPALISSASANRDKAYPWGGDFGSGDVATAHLQATPYAEGLNFLKPETTSAVVTGNNSWRKSNFAVSGGEGRYVYFAVNPQFAPFGSKDFEISATVRRTASDKPAGMSLQYESVNGYVNVNYTTIPEGEDWQTLTWKVSDANFAGAWGWNFRLNAVSSPNEFFIKEVRVKKLAQR